MGEPGQTSKAIFTTTGLRQVLKTTRNHIIGTMASMRAPLKLPPLMLCQRNLKLEWIWKSMTLDISYVLFTDETRTILDRSDSWSNGWVSPAFTISTTGWRNVKGGYHWVQTCWPNQECLEDFKWLQPLTAISWMRAWFHG